MSLIELDPVARSMLQAVFAMGALTMLMAIWMTAARMPAMRQAGLTLKDAEHTQDLRARIPSSARRIGDNYNHLFEAPTVFYAVSLATVVAGLADSTHVASAWTFVAARTLHSLVQATVNHVPTRILLYTISWLALATMIVRGAMSIV